MSLQEDRGHLHPPTALFFGCLLPKALLLVLRPHGAQRATQARAVREDAVALLALQRKLHHLKARVFNEIHRKHLCLHLLCLFGMFSACLLGRESHRRAAAPLPRHSRRSRRGCAGGARAPAATPARSPPPRSLCAPARPARGRTSPSTPSASSSLKASAPTGGPRWGRSKGCFLGALLACRCSHWCAFFNLASGCSMTLGTATCGFSGMLLPESRSKTTT